MACEAAAGRPHSRTRSFGAEMSHLIHRKNPSFPTSSCPVSLLPSAQIPMLLPHRALSFAGRTPARHPASLSGVTGGLQVSGPTQVSETWDPAPGPRPNTAFPGLPGHSPRPRCPQLINGLFSFSQPFNAGAPQGPGGHLQGDPNQLPTLNTHRLKTQCQLPPGPCPRLLRSVPTSYGISPRNV